jgi:hypothetical protein
MMSRQLLNLRRPRWILQSLKDVETFDDLRKWFSGVQQQFADDWNSIGQAFVESADEPAQFIQELPLSTGQAIPAASRTITLKTPGTDQSILHAWKSMDDGEDGQVIRFVNEGPDAVSLWDQDGYGLPTNLSIPGYDPKLIWLLPRCSADFIFLASISRWLLLSTNGFIQRSKPIDPKILTQNVTAANEATLQLVPWGIDIIQLTNLTGATRTLSLAQWLQIGLENVNKVVIINDGDDPIILTHQPANGIFLRGAVNLTLGAGEGASFASTISTGWVQV